MKKKFNLEADWFLPENVAKRAEQERQALEKGNVLDSGLGYAAYLKNKDKSVVSIHNMAKERDAFYYAQHINFLLYKLTGIQLKGRGADMGCGIGTISYFLHKVLATQMTGIDMYEDAIQAAKRDYPSCDFFAQSADELDNFEDESFDFIHSREFYPFTRTNSQEYHEHFLSVFAKKIKKGGVFLTTMVCYDKGLLYTYPQIDYKALGYSHFVKYEVFHQRLFMHLGTLAYNESLGFLFKPLNALVKALAKEKSKSYLYIFVK